MRLIKQNAWELQAKIELKYMGQHRRKQLIDSINLIDRFKNNIHQKEKGNQKNLLLKKMFDKILCLCR